MSTKVLSGKDLRKIGYPEGRVIGIVIAVMYKFFKNKANPSSWLFLRTCSIILISMKEMKYLEGL
jgi:hypothetical protein